MPKQPRQPRTPRKPRQPAETPSRKNEVQCRWRAYEVFDWNGIKFDFCLCPDNFGEDNTRICAIYGCRPAPPRIDKLIKMFGREGMEDGELGSSDSGLCSKELPPYCVHFAPGGRRDEGRGRSGGSTPVLV